MANGDQTDERLLESVQLIQSQLVSSYEAWRVWKATFVVDAGESKEQLAKLLFDVLGYAARSVSISLFDEAVLGLARFLDPAKRDSRINLGIEAVLRRIEPDATSQLSQGFRMRLDELRSDAQPIRVARDKVIAHTDLRDDPSSLLAQISPNAIEDLFTNCHTLWNQVLDFGGLSSLKYEVLGTINGTPEALQGAVRNSRRYWDLRTAVWFGGSDATLAEFRQDPDVVPLIHD